MQQDQTATQRQGSEYIFFHSWEAPASLDLKALDCQGLCCDFYFRGEKKQKEKEGKPETFYRVKGDSDCKPP